MKQLFAALLLCFISSTFAGDPSAPAAVAPPGTSAPAAAEPSSQVPLSATDKGAYGMYAFLFTAGAMTLFLFAGFNMVASSILPKDSGWSIKDALSEESTIQPDDKSQPPHMVASSSRLIAFLGTWAIVGLLIGLSYFMLWALFLNQDLSRLDKVSSFLSASWTLFVPYIANKAGSAISSIGRQNG